MPINKPTPGQRQNIGWWDDSAGFCDLIQFYESKWEFHEPERKLYAAVLLQATVLNPTLQDRDWVQCMDIGGITFRQVCHAFDFDPFWLREMLLKSVKFGEKRHWRNGYTKMTRAQKNEYHRLKMKASKQGMINESAIRR